MVQCVIDGDLHKLRQVMRNFVSNALKCTPSDGTVKVHVALQKQSSFSSPAGASNALLTIERIFYGKSSMLHQSTGIVQPPYVIVQVIDTGHGIATHNLPRVFNEIIQFNAGELQNGVDPAWVCGSPSL